MSITEYKIATDLECAGLQKKVDRMIREGWEPQGGAGVKSSGIVLFFQAMIKRG